MIKEYIEKGENIDKVFNKIKTIESKDEIDSIGNTIKRYAEREHELYSKLNIISNEIDELEHKISVIRAIHTEIVAEIKINVHESNVRRKIDKIDNAGRESRISSLKVGVYNLSNDKEFLRSSFTGVSKFWRGTVLFPDTSYGGDGIYTTLAEVMGNLELVINRAILYKENCDFTSNQITHPDNSSFRMTARGAFESPRKVYNSSLEDTALPSKSNTKDFELEQKFARIETEKSDYNEFNKDLLDLKKLRERHTWMDWKNTGRSMHSEKDEFEKINLRYTGIDMKKTQDIVKECYTTK